jgi:hypothetical protein
MDSTYRIMPRLRRKWGPEPDLKEPRLVASLAFGAGDEDLPVGPGCGDCAKPAGMWGVEESRGAVESITRTWSRDLRCVGLLAYYEQEFDSNEMATIDGRWADVCRADCLGIFRGGFTGVLADIVTE